MHDKLNVLPESASPRRDFRQDAALGVCALILVSAPLLFGAVDRVFQIALTVALAVGFLLAPPALPRPGRFASLLAWVFAILFIVQEFGAASLFGDTLWRRTLSDNFGLTLPWHNPSPAIAFDSLLAAAVAAAWFFWVRSLAAARDSRIFLTWSLFFAAGVVAIVCFIMGQSTSILIYGLRETPGWTGFGPFPNRNHTACFLAMGAIVGCGLVTRTAVRKKPLSCTLAVILLILIIIAMLWTKSRGGLIAFVIGFFLFIMLTLAGTRSKSGLVAAISATLGIGALCLAFGARVLERFAPGGDIPTNTRWDVWKDTLAMWRDAPLFGHGLGAFGQLFALYQTFRLEDQVVLHPESSWLLWLTELGAIVLLFLVAALVLFLAKNIPQIYRHQHGFFLAVGCLAAAAVLLFHSLWDVPGHRWATAWFGLAALALACPPRSAEPATPPNRMLALIPFAIALFWALPLFAAWPAWSPLSLDQLLNRSVVSTSVSLAELDDSLRFFPLDSSLREAVGVRELETSETSPEPAWREFRIADRLRPNIWELPAGQAELTERFSPPTAFQFWTLAIERSGHRAEEIFTIAVRDTLNLPGAESFWSQYAATHPEFALSYAENFAGGAARDFFTIWWNARALRSQLMPWEFQAYYANAALWGTRAQFDQFKNLYAARLPIDGPAWVRIFRDFGDDKAAWDILSQSGKDPDFLGPPSRLSISTLQTQWDEQPDNFLGAITLAQALAVKGDTAKSETVILQAAAKPNAPDWFLKKAAWVYARRNDYTHAVSLALRGK